MPGAPTTAVSSVVATRVATAAVLVVAVLAALFLLPPYGWGFAVLAVITAGAHEWGRLIGLTSKALVAFVAVAFIIGAALIVFAPPIPGSGWPHPIVAVACGVATLFWIAFGAPAVMRNRQPAAGFAGAITAIVVLIGAFVAVVELQARSPWIVLAAMAIVWIADTAAFFAGRRFGKHKLAPLISPGKSWEGAWGGVGAVIVYALLLVPLASRADIRAPINASSIALWVAFAIALTGLSIVGDLYESLLKRRAGVKDSGTLLPGHGGILDRTDALLAAMPAVALAALAFVAPT